MPTTSVWDLSSSNLVINKGDDRLSAFDDLFEIILTTDSVTLSNLSTDSADDRIILAQADIWGSPATQVSLLRYPDNENIQEVILTKELDNFSAFEIDEFDLENPKTLLICKALGDDDPTDCSFETAYSCDLKISDTLSFEVTISRLGTRYYISADFDPGHGLSPENIASLLGKADDLNDWLLPELKDGTVEIRNISIQIDPADSRKLTYISIRLDFLGDKSWPLIPVEGFEFLTIGGLWTALAVDHPLDSTYRFPVVQVGGVLMIDNAHIEISARWPDLEVEGKLADGDRIEIGAILERFSLPVSGLPGGDDALSISALNFSADPLGSTKSFSFLCTIDNIWKISFPNGKTLSIDELSLYLLYQGGDTGGLSTSLSGKFTVAGIDLYLSADFQSGGLAFTGQAAMQTPIQIDEIIADLANQSGLGITLPGAIESATVSNIELTFDTSTKSFKFTFEASVTDPLTADIVVDLELNNDGAGNYQHYFSGQLTLGTDPDQRIFDLIFDQQSQAAPATPAGDGSPAPAGAGSPTTPPTTSNILIALYQKPDGDTVKIGDLVSSIVDDTTLVGNLNALTFTLKNALLVFEHDSGATPANKYLFAVDVDFGVDLSGLGNLPIIGQQLAGKGPLKLAFQPIVDSGFADTDLSAVKTLLPAGSPAIPDKLSGAFALATTITFGDFNKVINLGIEDKSQIDSGLPADTPSATADGSSDPTETAPKQSADVNKNFGALSISRLNLAYEAGTITLGIDGALKIGPLGLALFGLGASYKIQGSEFSAHLDGLMLDFEKPPLTITGGFFRIDRSPDPPDYVGELNLQMEEFGLLVLGAFSQMADGHPSMFLYVFVDVPLGGPVFFFVEGLAFGFGYNRRLEVPPIDKMYNFPLVADAIGAAPQPPGATGGGTPAQKADLLRAKFQLLADYIYPEEGQYFLAVGLKFNSFKIVDCFALLTIGFGEQLDFALMGIARVTTPPEEPVPTANIELAFSVRYDPAEGLIAANGILTPNTFVYSPLVRLEGGFAYYAWMKGDHEGDFVATIGGYHPAFQVPAHYPSPAAVPRLSLSWVLSDYITIKGEAYFALTPKAMMAGGRLVASFTNNPDKSQTTDQGDDSDSDDKKSVVDIEASFTAGVDFLIYWEPFHYEADAFVEIYAKASLDTGAGTLSTSLSARADLDIWGPEFAGTAKVTAKVFGIKVHFTMNFGDTAQQPPQKVDWDTFAGKFLPANFAQDALSLVIQGGLVKTIKASERTDGGSGDLWVVNPKDLVLAVSSLFPITDGATGIYANPVAGPDPQRDMRGQIIAQKPAGITSNLVCITRLDGEADSSFQFIGVNKNFPESLWTKNGDYATALPGINGDQVISEKGGYQIVPLTPPKSLATHSFHVSNLSYEGPDDPSEYLPLNLFPPKNFQFQPMAQADAGQIDTRDTSAAINRSALLNSMQFDAVRDVQLKSGMFDMFTERPEVFTYTAG